MTRRQRQNLLTARRLLLTTAAEMGIRSRLKNPESFADVTLALEWMTSETQAPGVAEEKK